MLNDMHASPYEINPLTMAIIAKENKDGTMNTYVLEERREYEVHPLPTKVIDFACKYFGSSLRGRLDGTRDISRLTHKAPIVIDPSSGMYFFPTTSPTNKRCSWISHSHIQLIQEAVHNKTEFTFHNGKRIIIDASYGSMINQVQRTAQFRYSLDNRLLSLKNKSGKTNGHLRNEKKSYIMNKEL